MPNIRIGFASDFTLKNNLVGFGTTTSDRKLEVAGTLKGDLQITGIATLTEYGGFAAQKQNITQTTNLGFSTTGIGSFQQSNELESGYTSLVGEFNTLSDDLIVDDGKIFEIKTTSITGVTTIGTQSYDYDTSTVSLGALESVSIQSHFTLPNGGIETRPENPIEGTVRFNDDLNTLEFYNGIEWRQFTVTGASGRGVFGGGQDPSNVSTISYLNINSQGNEEYFGELVGGARSAVQLGQVSSSIRGLFGGGFVSPLAKNEIEYVTIASKGDSIDFGDLSVARGWPAAFSSSTRGIWATGFTAPLSVSNVIDYVEIPTLGTALDFGDSSTSRDGAGGVSNPTRGIFGAGVSGSPYPGLSSMEFVTISSKGDAVNFGDLTQRRRQAGTACNSVRGIFAGGLDDPSINTYLNVIDYITMSSVGNAIDFGDLTINKRDSAGASTQIRAVFSAGLVTPAPVYTNIIDFVTIASKGNAQDFGDSIVARNSAGSVSDSHGGLGGF